MAFESTRNLLSSLIQQQRETELMQQTPQFQAAVDQLFANRIQFAQNQVVMDKLGRAQSNDEIWEALKVIKPEDYVKHKREQLVGGQIFDLLKKSPEQERDYGLINYLASSIGYGDVGPIERRPMPEEALEQQLKLYKSKKSIDKYYGDREVPPYLRMQREREFMDYLDRGILYEGQPATDEQKDQLQRTYLKEGFVPKEFDIEARPEKPEPRMTGQQVSGLKTAIKDQIKNEWDKIPKQYRRGGTWGFFLNDLSEEEQDETLISLSNTPRGELIKAGLSNELISNLKTYGEWTKQATIENIKGGARLEPIEFNEKIYNNELIMTPKGLLPMYTIHQGALIKLDPETGEGEVIDIISDESLIKDERSYGVGGSY